jgi:putative ABC transport system permease protein
MFRFYRFLLRWYPAGFREEFGATLERQCADEYRDAKGFRERAALVVRLLWDFAVSWPVQLWRELRQDAVYSLRSYARKPLAPAMAIAALALGIGATTGVFSVVNAVLLRSLPFRQPDRLVQLTGGPGFWASPSEFHRWAANRPYVSDVVEYASAEMNLAVADEAARVRVTESSANFFDVMGSRPVIGRGFAADEDTPGNNAVAVISYSLWQQRFGGDAAVLGTKIRIANAPLTVIGVARAGMDYPSRTAIWTPTVFEFDRLPKGGMIAFFLFGRLQDGLTLDAAQRRFTAEVKSERPEIFGGAYKRLPALTKIQEQLSGPVRKASLVLLGAVALVLLIACANVANLLLTRVTDRRREMVVRAALGVSRARLVQQLITESVLLAGVAASAGLLVARWTAQVAAAAQPAQSEAQSYTILDWRVVAFAAGLTILTGLLFGVFPAWMVGRLQPQQDLVRGHSGGHGPAAGRFRRVLIAAQVALTLMLVAGSAAMGGTFLRLLHTDLGFQTGRVLSMTASVAGTSWSPEGRRDEYFREALERLRSLPGVEAAGATDTLPLDTAFFRGGEVTLDSDPKGHLVMVMTASPDYFRAMGTPIVQGREFLKTDTKGSARVVLVNDQFVKELGPGAQVVGRTVSSKWLKPSTIVGVVRSIRYTGPGGGAETPHLINLSEQQPPQMMTFAIRVRGNPSDYAARCRDALRSLDRGVPVFNVKTLDERLAENLARPKFYTTVVLFFGGFALLLVLMGIYGVASYAVAQRTHEIGVRLAIGARVGPLRAMLMSQGLLPVAVGIVGGVAGAVGTGKFLRFLVNDAEKISASACVGVGTLLVVTAAAAIWIATRRIARLDPIAVLRSE